MSCRRSFLYLIHLSNTSCSLSYSLLMPRLVQSEKHVRRRSDCNVNWMNSAHTFRHKLPRTGQYGSKKSYVRVNHFFFSFSVLICPFFLLTTISLCLCTLWGSNLLALKPYNIHPLAFSPIASLQCSSQRRAYRPNIYRH